MRRRWLAGMLLTIVLCGAACGCTVEGPRKYADTQSSATLPRVISEDEYIVYENVYTQQCGYIYEGEKQTKEGIFSTMYDYYTDTYRYFVWGYCDDKLDRDWKWELKISDATQVPPDGSLIQVTGKFEENETALFGYWLTRPSWIVKTEYTGTQYDINMACMNASLEAAQVMSVQLGPKRVEGKTVAMYGRVISPTGIIQHPYQDDAWVQSVSTEGEIPPVGTMVLVEGRYQNGVVADATITVVECYG